MLIAAGASATLSGKNGQTPAGYLAVSKTPPQSNPEDAPTSDASIRALTNSSARLSAISSGQPSAEVNSENQLRLLLQLQ